MRDLELSALRVLGRAEPEPEPVASTCGRVDGPAMGISSSWRDALTCRGGDGLNQEAFRLMADKEDEVAELAWTRLERARELEADDAEVMASRFEGDIVRASKDECLMRSGFALALEEREGLSGYGEGRSCSRTRARCTSESRSITLSTVPGPAAWQSL